MFAFAFPAEQDCSLIRSIMSRNNFRQVYDGFYVSLLEGDLTAITLVVNELKILETSLTSFKAFEIKHISDFTDIILRG